MLSFEPTYKELKLGDPLLLNKLLLCFGPTYKEEKNKRRTSLLSCWSYTCLHEYETIHIFHLLGTAIRK